MPQSLSPVAVTGLSTGQGAILDRGVTKVQRYQNIANSYSQVRWSIAPGSTSLRNKHLHKQAELRGLEAALLTHLLLR